MDIPGAGCGGFNNSRPVRKFNISARVTNNGDSTIKASDWYMAMKKANGASAYVCYYGYTGGQSFPDIPAKSMRDVTFAAFIELNETVARAYIFLRDGAVSNSLNFP